MSLMNFVWSFHSAHGNFHLYSIPLLPITEFLEKMGKGRKGKVFFTEDIGILNHNEN